MLDSLGFAKAPNSNMLCVWLLLLCIKIRFVVVAASAVLLTFHFRITPRKNEISRSLSVCIFASSSALVLYAFILKKLK